jgi:hypothetical protein
MRNYTTTLGGFNPMSKSALKLFMLRHGQGGAIVTGDDGKPLFYSDKMVAKAARKDGQVVSLGPDHNHCKAHEEIKNAS